MEFHVTPFQDMIKEIEGREIPDVLRAASAAIRPATSSCSSSTARRRAATNVSRFQLAAVRRAVERVPAQRARRRADRRSRARCARSPSAYMPIFPALFRLENDYRPAVAAGILAAALQQQLEIPRHRRREAQCSGALGDARIRGAAPARLRASCATRSSLQTRCHEAASPRCTSPSRLVTVTVDASKSTETIFASEPLTDAASRGAEEACGRGPTSPSRLRASRSRARDRRFARRAAHPNRRRPK